jgi:mono/diheme cytochrome c family protein
MAPNLTARIAMMCAIILMACETSTPPVDVPIEQAPMNSVAPERLTQKLVFKSEGEVVATLTVAEIAKASPLQVWTAFDPYYQKPKTWRVFELEPALKLAYGEDFAKLKNQELILRAKDGYQVPTSGQDLLRPGAFIAIEDMDAPSWELIGPQKANPGPFYMVWKGADQQDHEVFPRPWQLAEIEVAKFEQLYPNTVPIDVDPKGLAGQGYELFKAQCSRCHAINQQGGRVGPDLNVPLNITEYRPEAQIRAYIKNPLSFRYGNMPAFSHLKDQEVDGLIAYLKVMRVQKHDPAQAESK